MKPSWPAYNSFLGKLLPVALLVVAFFVKAALVDTNYNYSFEPDTPPSVEITKTFYFFLKRPCKETAPSTLTAYPNYSDGQYISAALVATAIAPLAKAGIIQAPLKDSDNSLIIYSMRWSGVWFDATATLFVYLMIVLLTGQTLIAFLISGLYYLFNVQMLTVDFARTDHYTLFAATWAGWAALKLYNAPERAGSYIWAAVGAGLVSATKINFPFYLLLLAAVIALLIYFKQTTPRHLLLFAIVLVLTFCLLYLRWLMYTENILEVLRTTLVVGEDWAKFWGTGNHFYYLWHQFFSHGFSWKVVLFLLVFYASFAWVLFQSIVHRHAFHIALCSVFVLQMLALMFSPKVGRYGLIVPVWASLFVGLAFAALHQKTNRVLLTAGVLLAVLLPLFTYRVTDYKTQVTLTRQKMQSINETRIAAANYIRTHFKAGSVIALQHPAVSNPPIFEIPYTFNYSFLAFDFLHRNQICYSPPPAIDDLKKKVNAIVINDKERKYHLNMLSYHACDDALYRAWQNFYNNLDSLFNEVKFESEFENYGVSAYYVYPVNTWPMAQMLEWKRTTEEVKEKEILLKWQYVYGFGNNGTRFQIQIAEDPAMRWLTYGNRRGYLNKYRAQNPTVPVKDFPLSTMPEKVEEALENGVFDHVLPRVPLKALKPELQNFFDALAVRMATDTLTVSEALEELLNGKEEEFEAALQQVYPQQKNLLNAGLKEYVEITRLEMNIDSAINTNNLNAEWQWVLPKNMLNKKTYYWRVRAKNGDRVLSDWSPVDSFRVNN